MLLVMRGRALIRAALVAGALSPSRAMAQVKWDVGAEAGVVKRFTSGSSSGVSSPNLGPSVEVLGHVAVVPMVRVGLYASIDLVPQTGQRSYWEGGAQVRVTPPLLPAPWRTWAFAGVGYAYAYQASFELAAHGGEAGAGASTLVDGVSGGLIEIPLGVGLGYRTQGPWTLFAELGARVDAGLYGPMYVPGGPGNSQGTAGPSLGRDSFALSLGIGLSFDP